MELCAVCAVSYREVAEAVRQLDSSTTFVSLEPTSIEGIFNTISTVGAMAEAEDEASELFFNLGSSRVPVEFADMTLCAAADTSEGSGR